MARSYATPQEYQAWRDPDNPNGTPPAGAAHALREASREIRRITLCACYDADATGIPTDPTIRTAFAEATCAQAAWARVNGDAEGDGVSPYSEVKIGSITLKRATAAETAAASKASGEAAFDILQDAGIVPAAPIAP